MDDIHLREATVEDRALLVRFMGGLQTHECTLEENRAAPCDSVHEHLDYLLADIAAKQGKIFIAELGAQAVGFIVCAIEEDNGAYVKPQHRRFGYINDIFVDESARGRGVAERLIDAAEAHCRSCGVDHMRLYVLANNDLARAFYDKSGWAPYEVAYRKPL